MFESGELYLCKAIEVVDDPYQFRKNGEIAISFFKKAVQQNNYVYALLELGFCYLNGIGVEKANRREAEIYYRRAADQGNGAAVQALLNDLGIFYSEKEQQLWQEMSDIIEFAACDIYATGDIPENKLRNAIAEYAKDANPKQVLGLYDDTFWGSGSDGFLIVPNGIRRPNAAEAPSDIRWEQIKSIDIECSTILISCDDEEIYIDMPEGAAQMISDLRDLYVNHFKQYYS